jgi:hypothetical protein
MIPSSSIVRTNWLDSQPKSSTLRKYKDLSVCVAGGNVNHVLFPMELNDLNIKLKTRSPSVWE